jgi:hypothetical protein
MISRAIWGSSPGRTLSIQRRGRFTVGLAAWATGADFVVAFTAVRDDVLEREGDAVDVIWPPWVQVPSRYLTLF